MPKISAIGFDWGGVVSQYPGKSFNDAAAEFLGVDNEAFRRAYFLHNHMVNKGPDAKTYETAVEMWLEILTELGIPGRTDAFVEFVRARPQAQINEEVVGLIKRLRRLGWKVGLFSNNSAENATDFRYRGYDTWFDVSLFSGDVNRMKPEPEAFEMLAEALGVPVTELVFIDDSERSLSTAAEVGYEPILFTTVESLTERLEELGLLRKL
ncbi:MAG: HAD-IA family hydrolase [Candidatus Uhrbacteria bacterium]